MQYMQYCSNAVYAVYAVIVMQYIGIWFKTTYCLRIKLNMFCQMGDLGTRSKN